MYRSCAATGGKRSSVGAAKTVSKTAVIKRSSPSRAARELKGVCINLKSRPDRWLGLQKSMAKHAPWLRLQRTDAVDGRIAPPPVRDVVKRWNTARLAKLFHWYRPKMVKMSPGERGCCASHLKAWRICARSGKPLLVLEDDACLLPAFTASLSTAIAEAPAGTGALWLTSKDRGSRKRVGKALMQPTYLWTTVGYVIWPAAAKAFMKLLPMDMPVDNFMAWHIKEGTVKAFSVAPAAVRQSQTWNIGSDVPHSDDCAMWYNCD